MEELLKRAFAEGGFSLTPVQTKRFEQYVEILTDWNQRMNLTAIEAPEEVVYKHFLDSVLTMKVTGELAGLSLIDVGTGAGFPGVPLKIMEEQLDLCLFDSLQKRINFLQALCMTLGFDDVRAVHGRAEEFGQKADYRECFDLATARAVAKLPVLAELCLPFVKKGGYFIALKGPELEEELEESKKAINALGGKISLVQNFSMDQGKYQRNLVVIDKIKHTPPDYPRKAGTVQKCPLGDR